MKNRLENLDNVKVGDRLCDNITMRPMKVIGVSEHYILCIINFFGEINYTIYSKEPEGLYHTGDGGHINVGHLGTRFFFRGPDNTVMGCFNYDYDNPQEYLEKLESGELDISYKKRVSLEEIYKVERKKVV